MPWIHATVTCHLPLVPYIGICPDLNECLVCRHRGERANMTDQPHILIVDDEHGIRDAMRMTFEADCTVSPAANGADALMPCCSIFCCRTNFTTAGSQMPNSEATSASPTRSLPVSPGSSTSPFPNPPASRLIASELLGTTRRILKYRMDKLNIRCNWTRYRPSGILQCPSPLPR